MSDGVNPYQAPEAPIAALSEKTRRPPVYTAISLFCWVVGAYHFIQSIVFIVLFILRYLRLGWHRLLIMASTPRMILMFILPILATAAYFAAGRLLWTRRGRPGLILCATGIGMTYLVVWSLGPR